MSKKTKRLLLLNLPYVLFALLGTKLGQAWRLAPGSGFSEKFLHLMEGMAAAFQTAMPSFLPFDLLIGVLFASIVWLAVYIKGKNAKNPSIRIGSDRRFARFDTLGAGYSAEELRAIISGTKIAPQRNKPRQEKPINLLVDIQTRMQQGKGPGYERWAKSFNLKQMAETVLYLQEHDLLYYPDLAKKANRSSARFRELSAEIKAAEQRMAELSIMRTHIINYAKTRDTYVAYRKAGYSKQFLAEHESDILLHKAAKKYFDDAGLKKLPAIKEINSEYAELIAKKKTAYAEYRKARDEMKELLIVKANVDRILGIEKDAEIEKDEPTLTRS